MAEDAEAQTPQHSWHPQPGRDVQIDARLLHALAHPMRNKLVGLLRQYGPSTATQLAVRLGVNTGATSYHLRQLAEVGLVVEDDERGNARDRWWKAVHRGSYFNEIDLLKTEPELSGAYLHGIVQTYAENMARAVDEYPTLPKTWLKATDLSDFTFYLTAKQMLQMREEMYAVMDKYRSEREDPHPRGARRITVQLQMFPSSSS
ncbi:MAG TPA: helix-turn-helix domain-containing protein [Jatrophihabitans sp.]|jgi:DNA-binding transcriptional ArsR family regulator